MFLWVREGWLARRLMFQNNERPSQQGNCLEFDHIDQDLLILESSTVVLNFMNLLKRKLLK